MPSLYGLRYTASSGGGMGQVLQETDSTKGRTVARPWKSFIIIIIFDVVWQSLQNFYLDKNEGARPPAYLIWSGPSWESFNKLWGKTQHWECQHY